MNLINQEYEELYLVPRKCKHPNPFSLVWTEHLIQTTGASRALGQDIHSIPQVTQHGDVKLGIIIILMISHFKPSDHLMQMFNRKGERTRLCGTQQVAGLLPSIHTN